MSNTYSDVKDLTPRYNYNQLMYRLSLDDPRLALPVPVYHLQSALGKEAYGTRETVDAGRQWSQVLDIPFFAVPPSRSHAGLVPLYAAFRPEGRPSLTDLRPKRPAAMLCAACQSRAERKAFARHRAAVRVYTDTQTGRHWYATDLCTNLVSNGGTRAALNPSAVSGATRCRSWPWM